MPATPPTPADDAFARRLFADSFVLQVRTASAPIFPEVLKRDRDEIVHQALVRAYEKRSLFRGRSDRDLLAWVLTILKNMTLNILEARKRRPEMMPLPEGIEDRETRFPAVSVGEEDRAEQADVPLPREARNWLKVAQDLESLLSPHDSDLLLLHYGHQFTAREIAEMLTREEGKPISVAAVKMRIMRAIRRIVEVAGGLGLEPRKPASREPSPEGDKGDSSVEEE